GNVARAGALAKEAAHDLEASGDGQAKATGDFGITLVPKQSVDVITRLEGLGRLIDATRTGLGDASLPTLGAVMEKRQEAIVAYSKRDFSKALSVADDAAKMLEGIDPSAGSDMAALWQLERDLGTGKASYESNNWTRPMLSMSEQLTLVLVL